MQRLLSHSSQRMETYLFPHLHLRIKVGFQMKMPSRRPQERLNLLLMCQLTLHLWCEAGWIQDGSGKRRLFLEEWGKPYRHLIFNNANTFPECQPLWECVREIQATEATQVRERRQKKAVCSPRGDKTSVINAATYLQGSCYNLNKFIRAQTQHKLSLYICIITVLMMGLYVKCQLWHEHKIV